MVEEDAGTGVQPVCVPVVGHQPVRRAFGHGVGATRPKRRVLICRTTSGVAEAFARAGSIEPDRPVEKPYRLEQIDRPDCRCSPMSLPAARTIDPPSFVRPDCKFPPGPYAQHIEHTAKIISRH